MPMPRKFTSSNRLPHVLNLVLIRRSLVQDGLEVRMEQGRAPFQAPAWRTEGIGQEPLAGGWRRKRSRVIQRCQGVDRIAYTAASAPCSKVSCESERQ
jgi:hypothetical protein